MSPSWIWSDKITNERVARVGYNIFISNKGEWNNCFSKFSNRVLPPIFISTILHSGKFLNYFPYDVKLRLLAHSRSFLANQKARNAIVGAENLLNGNMELRYWLVPGNVKNSWIYYTLSSLSLFWLAESVQWIFENSACDVITADYTIIMSSSRVIMSRSRVIMSWMTAVHDFQG